MSFKVALISVTTRDDAELVQRLGSGSSRLRLKRIRHYVQLVISVIAAGLILGRVNGDGPNCMQNGIGPSNLYANGVMNPSYMWSKAGSEVHVAVIMDSAYSHKERRRILGGFKEIEKKTCVQFHYYHNHTVGKLDHVYVTRAKQGCWSYIGRVGGKQEMSLPRGCISHRTAVHEMIHALGFAHEHVRADRDNYIQVNWRNIMPGRERNFIKRKTKSSDPYGPYDYGSIMHYDRKAFSFNNEDTLVPKKHGVQIGVDRRMSHWDTKKINRMYQCGNIYGGSGGGGGGYGYSNDVDDYGGDDDEEGDQGDDENAVPADAPQYNDDQHNHNHNDHGHSHGYFNNGRGHQNYPNNNNLEPEHRHHNHEDVSGVVQDSPQPVSNYQPQQYSSNSQYQGEESALDSPDFFQECYPFCFKK